jgi:hypothetical protein
LKIYDLPKPINWNVTKEAKQNAAGETDEMALSDFMWGTYFHFEFYKRNGFDSAFT